MGTLRYVKTPAELQEAAENNLEFFDATMQAVKVFYKTTPGLIEQLIPAPLSVADDPMVRIVMSRVFVDLHDGLEFGAATFGVNCKYKDIEGIYEITMHCNFINTFNIFIFAVNTKGCSSKFKTIMQINEYSRHYNSYHWIISNT